jgi:hypothetical protein
MQVFFVVEFLASGAIIRIAAMDFIDHNAWQVLSATLHACHAIQQCVLRGFIEGNAPRSEMPFVCLACAINLLLLVQN